MGDRTVVVFLLVAVAAGYYYFYVYRPATKATAPPPVPNPAPVGIVPATVDPVPPPPAVNAGPVPDLLWVRAVDLRGAVAHGGAVDAWFQVDRSLAPGVGATAGAGTKPLFDATGEILPFVRLEAGKTNPGVDGGYFDFGALSVRLATRGFTAVVCVRWRGPAAANWARVFDVGSGPGTQNLLLARRGATSQLNFQQHGATDQESVGDFPSDVWQVLAMRLDPVARSLTFVGPQGRVDKAWTPPTAEPTVFTNGYVGRSHWGGDAYATMDLREIRMYGTALRDEDFDAARTAVSRACGVL